MNDGRPPSPGYLWRAGSSPEHKPLLIVVALVIAAVVIGSVVLGIAVAQP